MPPYLPETTRSYPSIWLVVLAGVGIYFVARCVYLLYLHPLSHFPGPKLAALTESWHSRNMTTGRGCFNTRNLHRKYGDVVRLGPNRLSFATPEAYRDVYGHVRHGESRFLKNAWYELDEPRIVRTRDPIAHGHQRRALSHAFSARALRDQETVVHRYVDLLMDQFNKLGKGGKESVDATSAWNWLTFDVIGDLAFGESFEAVSQASNQWVQLILRYLRQSFLRRNARKYGPLAPLYMLWTETEELSEAARQHKILAHEKAQRRLELGDMGRADFFSHLLGPGKMTEGEVIGNADTLIVAGSETTATFLSGFTWYILKHADCRQKLTEEVRGTFQSFNDITGDAAMALPYLNGCIQEALRVFPPVPLPLPRDCPGAFIDGRYIPEGIVVQCDPFSMHTDPRFWADAASYRPERWIGAGFERDDKRAFQPFSTGPRACLGINMAYMEMRIAVAKMIWLYDLEMACEIEDWLEACFDFGLWRKPPLMVKFHPRTFA